MPWRLVGQLSKRVLDSMIAGERSRGHLGKQRFALDWMLSENGGNSITG